MTGGINYVSWNPSTVDRRKLRNNESAPVSAQSALSSLRRSKATGCDSAYSVESSFGGYERIQMRRGCASHRFAVLTHLARVRRRLLSERAILFSRAGRIYAVVTRGTGRVPSRIVVPP